MLAISFGAPIPFLCVSGTPGSRVTVGAFGAKAGSGRIGGRPATARRLPPPPCSPLPFSLSPLHPFHSPTVDLNKSDSKIHTAFFTRKHNSMTIISLIIQSFIWETNTSVVRNCQNSNNCHYKLLEKWNPQTEILRQEGFYKCLLVAGREWKN